MLKIHHALITSYGGSHGLRDEAALDGALAVPESTFGGEWLHPTVPEAAAAYLFHLCQNHPFIDGNKRIALAAAILFTKLNVWDFAFNEDEATELTLAVARGDLRKRDLTALFSERMKPGEA